ncbi:hypothetical protein MRX96_014431 [Rhipicephalus microplus]
MASQSDEGLTSRLVEDACEEIRTKIHHVTEIWKQVGVDSNYARSRLHYVRKRMSRILAETLLEGIEDRDDRPQRSPAEPIDSDAV